MATFSKKMGGKEVGQADVYAPPHTMSGSSVSATVPNKTGAAVMNEMNISVGNISKGNTPATKTSGTVTRGNGCAIKGITARGPMA
jgi:hypothetical protein